MSDIESKDNYYNDSDEILTTKDRESIVDKLCNIDSKYENLKPLVSLNDTIIKTLGNEHEYEISEFIGNICHKYCQSYDPNDYNIPHPGCILDDYLICFANKHNIARY